MSIRYLSVCSGKQRRVRSFAVNVVRWIGQRIAAVEAIPTLIAAE